MSKDYYKILGVDKSASQDELKKAYRKLAHQHHPDKSGGDDAKFKEINEAYQVLGDEKKRAQYDQFGSSFDQGGFGAGGFGGAQGFGGFQGGGFDMGDLGDIFGDFFGGSRGGGGRRVQRGADIEMDLRLDFKEAAFGVKQEISIRKNSQCSHCKGNGGEPGSKLNTCHTCKGSGQVTTVKRTIIGNIQSATVCPECQGEGKYYEKKCTTCHGSGIEKRMETIEVDVPGGIEDGMTIKLNGKGEVGPKGGPSGDLYLHVRISKHKEFSREGAHVVSDVKIPYSMAVLGGKIDVNTIDGEVTLKIPDGTQSGQLFVLRGKGANKFQRSGRGDHLVTVRIETPEKLNRKQKEIVKKLREEGL